MEIFGDAKRWISKRPLSASPLRAVPAEIGR